MSWGSAIISSARGSHSSVLLSLIWDREREEKRGGEGEAERKGRECEGKKEMDDQMA